MVTDDRLRQIFNESEQLHYSCNPASRSDIEKLALMVRDLAQAILSDREARRPGTRHWPTGQPVTDPLPLDLAVDQQPQPAAASQPRKQSGTQRLP